MKFADFFKKLISGRKAENSKKGTDKIHFNELENWIEKKRKETEEDEKEIFVLIKNKSLMIINELEEKLRILESIDIDAKKVEEQIKLIVKENLKNYIQYVRKFIEDLNELKEERIKEVINDINKIFLEFDKKSHGSYQKVTILIGKEIAEIKGIITNFFKYLKELFNNNRSIVDSQKIILFVELNLKEIDEITGLTNKIKEKIKFLENKIKNINEDEQELLKDIEKIKKSKEHIKNTERQEKLKLNEERLKNEVYSLKGMINFRALSNVFHVNEKEMNLIRGYKEDFQTLFQKDNGAEILRLFNEANLNNTLILTKINQIKEEKKRIMISKKAIKKDEVSGLLSKIEKTRLEIENLNKEKIKELKINKKLEVNKEEIIKLIKKEFSKINLEIVD